MTWEVNGYSNPCMLGPPTTTGGDHHGLFGLKEVAFLEGWSLAFIQPIKAI